MTGPEELRRRIAEQGVSQVQAAKRAGCSKQHLTNLLAGRVRPSLDLALRLERVLLVPPSAWYAQKGREKGVKKEVSP
jgi:transcriptional regulator with XRE-family HTH domain